MIVNSTAYVLSKNTYPTCQEAFNVGVFQGTRIVYLDNTQETTVLYGDSRLTLPIYGNGTDYYCFAALDAHGMKTSIQINESGVVTFIECPAPTTTTAAPTTTTAAPTTTTAAPTTTTAAPTTTTAAPTPTSYLRLNGQFPQAIMACDGWSGGSYSTVYAAEANIGSVTYLYTDSGLTNPVPSTNGNYMSIAVPSGPSYTNTHSLIVGSAGLVSALTPCPA